MNNKFNEKQIEFYRRFVQKHIKELVLNYNYFMENRFSHAMYHEPGIFLFTRINPEFSPHRKPDPDDNNIMKDLYLGEYKDCIEFRALVDKMYYEQGLERIIVYGEKISPVKEMVGIRGFTKIEAYYEPSDEFKYLKLDIVEDIAHEKPC